MWQCAWATERVGVVTQGEASLVVPTLGEGMVSSRRHLSAAEAPVTENRGARPSWQERMGLSLAEALRLPGLAETEVVAVANRGKERLERFAARFGVANTYLDYREMILKERPDLVILDMMMPKRSGFLVLEKLRRTRPTNERVKVIMITANEGSRHKAYAEYLGVVEYIRKPFAAEKLLAAVDKALSPPDGRQGEEETRRQGE